MPTTLVLTFPWGRYHATPWGSHVNEGAVELPPSPWRLLRALYAVWQTRAPELPADVVLPLLSRLAESPLVHVPRHTLAHTRHYYPDSTHTALNHSVDRTFDAFAVFGRDAELAFTWPFDLPSEQRDAFERIATSIPYLGRADSLCIGRVVDGWTATGHDEWAPLDSADSVDPTKAHETVLAPTLPLDVESLVARPVDVRRKGLLFPAGTRFLGYERTAEARRPRRRPVVREGDAVRAVRFTVLQSAFPPDTDAVIYTDLLRQAALAKLNRPKEERPFTMLGGRTSDVAGNERMRDQHRHAHFLPLFTERRLTGFVVWTPGGLPDDELKALTDVRDLWQMRDKVRQPMARVRVAGVGDVERMAPELARPMCGPSAATTWTSRTPFVAARHCKRPADAPAFLLDEVRRELAFRGFPEPVDVTPLDRGWVEWRRSRPSRGAGAPRPTGFFGIEFGEAVAGPIAVGHLSHFGLGLFEPER